MSETLDWRKLAVRRDSRFDVLEKRFCSTKDSSNNDAAFGTIKEFMVFAALIGFQLDDYQPIDAKSNAGGVLLEIFHKTKHDAYIYLIALGRKPSLDILKDDNLKEAIGIFEGYCNGGLRHIDNWVMNNISEPLVKNILFNQTLEYLINNE
jgi:dnd system-associated protein 4